MTIPCLSHDQAEAVGQELALWLLDRIENGLDTQDELFWADAVQLVLRRAGEMKADTEGDEE